VYGGTTGAGYMGGVGGGPQGGESALQTNVGTLAGLGFGYVLLFLSLLRSEHVDTGVLTFASCQTTAESHLR